jgi:hypothetical protein
MNPSRFLSICDRITGRRIRDAVPLLDISLDDSQNEGNPTTVPNVQIEQPSSTTNGHCAHDGAMYLRAKLRYFFMSPCWKWHLKRQFPWKAWFQFIKIIIVTAQVIEKREIHLLNASFYSWYCSASSGKHM